MSKSAARLRRVKVAESEAKPSPKEKFMASVTEIETAKAFTPKFEPKTQNQKLALAYLREGRECVFLTGSAGVGKSMIAAFWAASQLKQKKVEQIVLLRPNVHNGKSIGSLPGTESEKLAPFFVQTMQHLKKFLGGAYLQYCVEKEVIVTRAFEYVRGQSWENTIVIAEEVQNLDFGEFETLLTRVGEGTQLICTGDTRQVNKGFVTGMDSTAKMITDAVANEVAFLDDEDLDVLEDSVGVVHFTPEDIIRSGFCKAIVKLYYFKESNY